MTLQIALALILLMGAGLMINSFIRVQNNQLGIDPQNLLTFDVRFSQNDTIKPYGRYRNAGLWDVNPATTLTFQRVFERMQSVPGVVSAAAAGEPPVNGALGMGFLIDGRPAPAVGPRPARPERLLHGDHAELLRHAARPHPARPRFQRSRHAPRELR